MVTTYRATLHVSLHDAPNPLDVVATDWASTRASGFVEVGVEMTGGTITRENDCSLVATRAVPAGAVWAMFVDRWGPAKPVFWAVVGRGLDAGTRFDLPAGADHVTFSDEFTVRNAAAKTDGPGAEPVLATAGTAG